MELLLLFCVPLRQLHDKLFTFMPVVIMISETLELGGICLCLPSAYKWRVRTMVVLSTLE